jgi:hypothetical protein
MQKFQRLLKPQTEQEKQKQQILILLLIAGIGYYFFSYLPSQERKELETLIQSDINKVQNIQPTEYSSHLTKLRSYLN